MSRRCFGIKASPFFFMYVFYLFATLVMWLGIQSLRSGLRYSAYVRREVALPPPDFTPFASIIAPHRGVDQELRENLETLFSQNYPQYEIVFVTDNPTDPSVSVIEEARTAHHGAVPSHVAFAGKATDSGQKVHNLRMAVGEIDPRSEVLVFVDSDARPDKNWLRSLVGPLRDDAIGAATGYRWFISFKSGLASQMLSVWNASIASALGERSDRNFCWGGSTALRRSIFEKLQIRELWRGTVSDDFTLMRSLQKAKLPIKFVPACLTASAENFGFRQLFEFTTRQLQITRVYATHLWKAVLFGSLLFNLVFFGGLVLVIARGARGLSVLPGAALLAIIFILGTVKACIRLHAVSIILTGYSRELRRSLLAHMLLWPLASSLFLYDALVAAFSRRISWRGISYELKSPNEAVIISREPAHHA